MRFLIVGIVIIGALLALLPHIVYVLAKLVSLVSSLRVSYRPFGYVAFALVGIWFALFCFGNVYGRFRHEVKQVSLTFETLPEPFDGLRIVHISDLHLEGWTGHERQLKERIEEINALKPDIICFTGDLISMDVGELKPFVPILKALRAKEEGRVYAVLGNHDYMPYNRSMNPRERTEAVAELVRMEREELGWTVLLNESAMIHRGKDSIAILGCENQSVGAHPVIQRGDLAKAMEGNEDNFSILLTHDPSQWRKEVLPESHIPLTLSGHTHAMQLRILGFTPSKWVYPECDGLYTEGDQHLYVNIGLGSILPWRIGATPEITLMTLNRALKTDNT